MVAHNHTVDSLGNDVETYPDIENYLKAGGVGFTCNTVKYQPSDSKLCGLYCLVVADLRCRGKKMNEVLSLFDSQILSKNDATVTAYFLIHMYNGALAKYL